MADNRDMRLPQQERGKETRNKIIEAAVELFSTKGYYKTNSKEIAMKAGVSIGSFYMYFKDKKSVFIEALDNYYENVSINKDSREHSNISMPSNKKELINSLIKQSFKLHNFLPQFHREITFMSYSDLEIQKIIEEREKILIDNIHSYLQMWQNEIKISDLDVSSFVIFSVIESNIHKSKFSSLNIDQDKLINELANLISEYLF